jgi:6-pyruvoyltetrahydropterin/6-carboxytetrahydropterin synthase
MLISKSFAFEASHILPRHPGRCSRLHGHSWRVRVEVEGSIQNDSQFVADYAQLSNIVNPIVDRFDHRHLNCYIVYPSAENIATHIAHELRPMLSSMDRFSVAVSETQKTWAVWDSRRVIDLRRLELPLEDGGEWRAPALERVVTDVAEARKRISILNTDAKKMLLSYQELMTEALQTELYIDTLDLSPELPVKPTMVQ